MIFAVILPNGTSQNPRDNDDWVPLIVALCIIFGIPLFIFLVFLLFAAGTSSSPLPPVFPFHPLHQDYQVYIRCLSAASVPGNPPSPVLCLVKPFLKVLSRDGEPINLTRYLTFSTSSAPYGLFFFLCSLGSPVCGRSV